IKEWLAEKEIGPDPLLERDLITYLSNHLLGEASPSPAAIPVPHHQRAELAREIGEVVAEIAAEEKIQLNAVEQRNLVTKLVNDMVGLGPLEPLLADEGITDIMVNGPNQIYIERGGKLELSKIRFRDDAHVMNVATRIVSAIGRR